MLESSISGNMRNFFQGRFFELGLESAGFHFRKHKKRFILRKYKQSFPLRKYKNYFDIRASKFHFPKYKEIFSGWIFFVFLYLDWEVFQVTLNITTFLPDTTYRFYFERNGQRILHWDDPS